MKFERFNHPILSFSSPKYSGSQIPCPVLMEKDGAEIIRVFFSARDKDNKSNIFYSDHDAKTLRLLHIHDEPVMDLGLPGTFSADGLIASQCVIRDQTEFLLYVGVNIGPKESPYRYEQGLASRPLGSEEKFTPLGNILTRSEINPVGVSMPFYVKYDFDPARGPNPNYLTRKEVESQNGREFLFFITFLPWKEQAGEGGAKRWEPTYKIEFVELDKNEKDFEMKLKYNYLGSPEQKRRPKVMYNSLIDDKWESPISLGRPWVFQEGDHLSMLYCERTESLYRGECWERGYKLRMSESSNLNVGWFGFGCHSYLTDYYIPRHVDDKMQAYPSVIENSDGDRFLLFNNNFQSAIHCAKWTEK